MVSELLCLTCFFIFFRKYYIEEPFTWLQWGHKILDFSAIPYGWYIEMWIGLFLIIPFLNILYCNIPIKKQKLVLIGILFLMTAIPDFCNRYGLHIIPAFWQKCFPITFYFIGCYINEYKPRVKKVSLWLIILAVCLINPIFNVLLVNNHTLVHIVGGPSGVFGTILATLFFIALYQLNIKSPYLKESIAKVSLFSLDMYLCCYIFDQLVYPYFEERFFVNQSQYGIYFFVIVPIIFVGSFVFAWIKYLLCRR